MGGSEPSKKQKSRENPCLATALQALQAGLSVIPVRADGTKAPALKTWRPYQKERAKPAVVHSWFRRGEGLGVVGGTVSGNLEVLDFDSWDIFVVFTHLVRTTGHGELVDRLLAGYQEQTPKGVHLAWQCETIAGNTKLAQRIEKDERGQERCDEQGNRSIKSLIETRGEGGFAIIAPSKGRVHPSGKPYILLHGSVATIPTITPEEREELLAVARSFNEVRRPQPVQRGHQGGGYAGERPADLYNKRVTWEEVLEPKGWVKVYEREDETYWRRPGKERGVSATTNYAGCDLLYVFSTSTVFEAECPYTKFAAYALLYHHDDFKAAAEALAAAGYHTEKGVKSASRLDLRVA